MSLTWGYYGGRDLVQMLRGVIVATDNRRHDFRITGQQLRQETARPHGSGMDLRRYAGVFLAAQAAKELVDVVDYAHYLSLWLGAGF